MEHLNLNDLEERICQIENDVLSADTDDEKILLTLSEVHETLSAFSSKRERFNQVFKKVPLILEYLSPGFIDTVSVSDDFQKEVVLSAENDIKSIAKQLNDIDNLSKVLDSKKIPEIPSYEGRLLKVEAEQQQQLIQLSKYSQDLNNLLSALNQMILSLSQNFVKLDMLLSQKEEEQMR